MRRRQRAVRKRTKKMNQTTKSWVSHTHLLRINWSKYSPERLQKEWRSKVYAFFRPDIKTTYIDNRKCHEFTCNAKNCKGKGKNPRVVRRFLDTKDKASTKTLRVHAISCWGRENVDNSDNASNIESAREALKGAELRDGSITAVFERTGKGKISYSHRNHTDEKTRYKFCLVTFPHT